MGHDRTHETGYKTFYLRGSRGPSSSRVFFFLFLFFFVCLFSRVLILFSHTFFFLFLFFLSFFSFSSSRTSFLNRRSTEEVSRCKVRFRDDFRDKCYCCIVWPRFEERGDSGCRLMICWDEFRKFLTVQGLCCCY